MFENSSIISKSPEIMGGTLSVISCQDGEVMYV